MSSHHVIRENQEAAIFLVNRNSVVKEVLENFFEWSPLILTGEECFDLFGDWGFKADALICEKGFEENFETEIALQQPLDVIKIKNNTQLISDGLSYLKSKKCPAVNVFLDNDALFSERLVVKDRSMAVAVIRGDKRGIFVRSGLYEKWLPAASSLILKPLFTDQLFIFKYHNGSSWMQKINTEFVINIDREGPFVINSRQSYVVWEPV